MIETTQHNTTQQVCRVILLQQEQPPSRGDRSMASAAGSSAAAPFWRAAGMTYISYSNICASLVRNCLKEPYRSEAINREKVHFAVSKWADGKPEKPTLRSDSPDE